MKLVSKSMSIMKQPVMGDTLIRFSDITDKSSSADKVIECNVNMNVSLSNVTKSPIFQRTQSLLLTTLLITFLIAYTQLKREVQILEAQMNSINSNLAILILRNERFHKNFNRPKLQQSITKLQSYNNNDNDDNKGEMSPYNEYSSDTSVNNTITLSKLDENVEKVESNLNDRVTRSIITIGGHNETEKKTMLNDMEDDRIDSSITWGNARAGRLRRDDGRGKQRRKSKRRLKRSRRRLGPLVATFVGGVPEQHVTDTVYIGPWVRQNESRYSFNKFHLVEDKRSIEVTVNGLFMISTQIYYFGEPSHYSYWILLTSEGSSITRKVIKCATVSAVSATETSCYTSVILPLRRGDRLHIQQQERDRLINLREGHSYVQIILLSNEQQKRRTTTTSIDRL